MSLTDCLIEKTADGLCRLAAFVM